MTPAPSTVASTPVQGVPFAAHTKVEICSSENGTASTRIPDATELTNHVGSVHAGALFTVGETASGRALMSALGDLLGHARVLVRKAEIRYLRLARGAITAHATLARPADEIRAQLRESHRADFSIGVRLLDPAGEAVAQMDVDWNISIRPAAAP